MLDEYRSWLVSELALLGNASHHAYSFGQANMAKRAIERLDETLAGKTLLVLDAAQAALLREALESRTGDTGATDATLRTIHAALQTTNGERP